MRRHLTTAALVIAVAATATACNGDGQNVDNSKPSSSAGADKSPAPQGGGTSGGGSTGQDSKPSSSDTLTLKGKGGEQVAVTLKGFADPAQSDNKFMKPAAGKHWVAAQFELVNKGSGTYTDAPANGAKLVDTNGQNYTQTLANITEGPTFPGTVNLGAGEKALGWVVFSVPDGTKPKAVQYTLDSGTAKDTGEWVLKK